MMCKDPAVTDLDFRNKIVWRKNICTTLRSHNRLELYISLPGFYLVDELN